MPVHVHSGQRRHERRTASTLGSYVTEVRWWSTRPLWFLLWAGVFERHPDLRSSSSTECGAFWAADLLWTMDTAYDREHGAKKLGEQLTAHLSHAAERVLRPELLDRRVEHPTGASSTRRYEIGVGNIMWGNDFPHPEGTWPHTREWLRDAFHDIPVDETRAILGLNAGRLLRLRRRRARAARRSHRPHHRRARPARRRDRRTPRQVGRRRRRGPAVAHRHRGRRGPDRRELPGPRVEVTVGPCGWGSCCSLFGVRVEDLAGGAAVHEVGLVLAAGVVGDEPGVELARAG